MKLTFDLRQPVQQTVGSEERPRPWILGVATVDRGPLAVHPYSYMSECECPDDCLRDHEND